jgi:hypothetical protein
MSQNKNQLIQDFYSAPNDALFDQIAIAAVLGCSKALMERNRWAGNGVQFLKIGRTVRYRKADVIAWLAQYQPQKSTSETQLREVA